jgi:hypothetical protein
MSKTMGGFEIMARQTKFKKSVNVLPLRRDANVEFFNSVREVRQKKKELKRLRIIFSL